MSDIDETPSATSWRVKILALFISLGVGVLLAEGLLRVTGIVTDRGGISTVTTRQFDEVPGIFTPGQEATIYQIGALPYQASTNELGYRGREIERQKELGTFRVLFAGDSFVYGDFVDDEETLPAQLESGLNARCTIPIEVVNAGLGGSTIRDQSEMIDRGRAMDPDLVVLQFSENDVLDLVAPFMWEQLAANREFKSRFPMSIAYRVMRGSAIWNLTLRVRALRQARAAEEALAAEAESAGEAAETEADAPPPDPMSAAALAEYRAEYARRLDDVRNELGADGIPLLFTVFPAHLSVYELWDSDQLEWLDSVVEELDIETVSYHPAFLEDGRDETQLYLLPHDGHASPEGYALAANVLITRLVESGPLAAACN